MGFSYHQLRTAELADLIAAAQADERDDSPAMNEIIRRFDRKAWTIAAVVCTRPADRDDVANVARLALVRAVRRHRTDGAGFVSYAVTFMTGAARRESQRLAFPYEARLGGFDLAVAVDNSPPALRPWADSVPVPESWGTGRIAKIVAVLPEGQQVLLTDRYVHDLELARIAQVRGTSVSAVSQRLATVHKHVIRIMQTEPVLTRTVAA